MCKQGVASRDAFAGLLTFILVMFLVCIGVGCGASSQPGATNSNGSTLTSIKVAPATATIPISGQQQFNATGAYSDNSTQDLTDTVV
jgi:hypothetical protein